MWRKAHWRTRKAIRDRLLILAAWVDPAADSKVKRFKDLGKPIEQPAEPDEPDELDLERQRRQHERDIADWIEEQKREAQRKAKREAREVKKRFLATPPESTPTPQPVPARPDWALDEPVVPAYDSLPMPMRAPAPPKPDRGKWNYKKNGIVECWHGLTLCPDCGQAPQSAASGNYRI